MSVRPMNKTPKYAPAREDGGKPYVFTRWGWGQKTEKIGWGTTPSRAAYDAYGRMGAGHYITNKRRATPADMDELGH